MAIVYKILMFFLLFQILVFGFSSKSKSEENFETWILSYKKFALEKGVSQKTIDITFKDVKFLDQVIKYDRKQPEFFEDTKTYVDKRANISRVKIARKLLKKNKILFDEVENNFFVELNGGIPLSKGGRLYEFPGRYQYGISSEFPYGIIVGFNKKFSFFFDKSS